MVYGPQMTIRLGRGTAAAPPARSRLPSTSRTRLRPPVAPSPHIRRDRLVAVLDGALERRLTIDRGKVGFVIEKYGSQNFRQIGEGGFIRKIKQKLVNLVPEPFDSFFEAGRSRIERAHSERG